MNTIKNFPKLQELSKIAKTRGITLMSYDKMTANSVSQSEKIIMRIVQQILQEVEPLRAMQ